MITTFSITAMPHKSNIRCIIFCQDDRNPSVVWVKIKVRCQYLMIQVVIWRNLCYNSWSLEYFREEGFQEKEEKIMSRTKQKPLGMRMGESVFCVGYLIFAVIAGLVFVRRVLAGDVPPELWISCAVMTFLLGAGDAFHLVPRILINVRGEADSGPAADRQAFWLGLGNLISSVTMTLFYIVFFFAVHFLADRYETDVISSAAGVWNDWLLRMMVVLAILRILLCPHPGNNWFRRGGSQNWGILRNIPFVGIGILTVINLLAKRRMFPGPYLLLAVLVVVSFICYMLVVLYAKKKPMMGMMMIPKTICYIWIIGVFLQAGA